MTHQPQLAAKDPWLLIWYIGARISMPLPSRTGFGHPPPNFASSEQKPNTQ